MEWRRVDEESRGESEVREEEGKLHKSRASQIPQPNFDRLAVTLRDMDRAANRCSHCWMPTGEIHVARTLREVSDDQVRPKGEVMTNSAEARRPREAV